MTNKILTPKLTLKRILELEQIKKNKLAEEIFESIDDQIINNTLIIEILQKRNETKYSLELAESFVNNSDPNNQTFAIYNIENEFVGIIGIEINTYNNNGNLGYWISKHQRKKGYIKQALPEFITYCFKILNLHKLTAETFSINKISTKILKKNNFKLCGTKKDQFKRNDKYYNEKIFELLNPNK